MHDNKKNVTFKTSTLPALTYPVTIQQILKGEGCLFFLDQKVVFSFLITFNYWRERSLQVFFHIFVFCMFVEREEMAFVVTSEKENYSPKLLFQSPFESHSNPGAIAKIIYHIMIIVINF